MGDDAGRVGSVAFDLVDQGGGGDPSVGVDIGIPGPFGIGVEFEHLDLGVVLILVGFGFVLLGAEVLFGFGLVGVGAGVEEVGEDLCERARLDRGEVGEEDLDLIVRAQAHEAEPFVFVFDDGHGLSVIAGGRAHHIDEVVEVVRVTDVDIEGAEAIAGIGQDLSEVRHASIVNASPRVDHCRRRRVLPYHLGMHLHVADHPLIAHKLTALRDENTDSARFRQLTEELVMLLAYEATRSVSVEDKEISTPVTTTTGTRIAEPRPVVVPILRAGLGMLDGMLRILPTAEVGFLGMVRDETTFEPSAYADRLPDDLTGRQIFVVDPMLATGGTLAMAIDFLLARGARDVTAVCLVSAPEGVQRIERDFSDSAEVKVYTAALDEKLNEKGYIVPGLGDAGDRMYGIVD